MTSNMIYIVAFGGGLKCLRKIRLKTQWGAGAGGVREIDSMSTRRGGGAGKADYAHHITTRPPRFADLPTSLIF